MSSPSTKRARKEHDVPDKWYLVSPVLQLDGTPITSREAFNKCKRPVGNIERKPVVGSVEDLLTYLDRHASKPEQRRRIVIRLDFGRMTTQTILDFGIHALSGIGGLWLVHRATMETDHDEMHVLASQIAPLAPQLWRLEIDVLDANLLLEHGFTEWCSSGLTQSLRRFGLAVHAELTDKQLPPCVYQMNRLQWLEVHGSRSMLTTPPTITLHDTALAQAMPSLRQLSFEQIYIDVSELTEVAGIEQMPLLHKVTMHALSSAPAPVEFPLKWCCPQSDTWWPQLACFCIVDADNVHLPRREDRGEISLLQREGITLHGHGFRALLRERMLEYKTPTLECIVAEARAYVSKHPDNDRSVGAGVGGCTCSRRLFSECPHCRVMSEIDAIARPVMGEPVHDGQRECSCCRERLEANKGLGERIRKLYQRLL